MKKTLIQVSIGIVALMSFGCAFNPRQVKFSQGLAVPVAEIGKGTEVGLVVKDERPDLGLGRRGTGVAQAAKISTADSMDQVVAEKFTVGLQNLGFKVTKDAATSRKITVELRFLEHSTSQGFWTGGVHSKGAVKVIAKFGATDFEKNFRGEEEERVMVVPTAEKNAELLNKILDQTLIKVFADEEFRALLRR
jgi:uncharacterized lipoprotein YajG